MMMMKTKPLLTPAEKAFLQTVIKPYRKWVVGIIKQKTKFFHTRYIIKIQLNTMRLYDIELPIDELSNSYQFKGLELDTLYELKTLGL